MQTLKEAVSAAWDKKIALGHFNVSDSNQFNAVLAAAASVGQPVLVGVSEGERKFFGVRNIAAMVAAARAAGVQVYLNADHTYSLDGCKEVIDAGFDSVIFDGSHLPMEENIATTKAVVEYARSKSASDHEILVEGEIGRIGTSSKLLTVPPEDIDKDLTTTEEAVLFVQGSGVDMLAPAVGTMHGRIIGGADPKIDLERIAAIRAAVGIPLVLHGGSGSTDDDLRVVGKAGCSIAHINTDIRVAYRKGIEASLAADTNEIAPYRFLARGVEGVEKMTEKYIRLFAQMS
jgi:fructose-bisphosphate aldolase class II